MNELLNKQIEFAAGVAHLIAEIYNQGYSCTLGEAYRTPEQAKIYAANGKGIVNSLHCKRLAIDLNLISPEGRYLTETKDYQHFGEYWEGLHADFRWGGRFKERPDGNHFEMQDIE